MPPKKKVVFEEIPVTQVISNVANQMQCECNNNDHCCSSEDNVDKFFIHNRHLLVGLFIIALLSSILGFMFGTMTGNNNYGYGYDHHRYNNGHYMNDYTYPGQAQLGMMGMMKQDSLGQTIMPDNSYLNQMDGSTVTIKP